MLNRPFGDLKRFTREGLPGKLLAGLLGVIFLMMGISLLSNPLAGVMSLTLVAAFLFLFGGIAKIIVAFMFGIRSLWLVALSGALSLLLAFMIFTNFPASALSVLGILLAVELISSGVSLISYGMTRDDQTV